MYLVNGMTKQYLAGKRTVKENKMSENQNEYK